MVLKKLGYNRVGTALDYSSGASLLGLKVLKTVPDCPRLRLMVRYFRLWEVNISMVATWL